MTKLKAKDIYDLYKEFHVPKNVIDHMVKVADVAEKLCDKFIKKGIKIDKELVVKAALLHDLLRVVDFKELKLKRIKQHVTSEDLEFWTDLMEEHKEINHADLAAKILNKRGHKRIANLVKKHFITEIDNLKTWEEKIVYYADKRVKGKRKVGIKRRMRKSTKEMKKKLIQLEKEIKKVLKD
ncbi:HD domain-containing protein [Candidatus Peregrinibacteria bacterium]|jgi:putative nucleotidyltransferase with HDIG domain|nr:HD domain-containing protein [Candidatus Peregrinibacteria bacterium]MBT4148261.1 HD domain-containing protein [Candidatus Peregrinibacteria bacterium]MBT4366567.1 HD domain-containing protein [Candidatus Peregrinibacteria bacterium]MBT4455954.1 HD domain-containing protein [Candidatus Peregrinibacteria bacterium]